MKNRENNNSNGYFVWARPLEGKIQEGIDVSSYGEEPFKRLSPFDYSEKYEIPVPGNEQIRAHSVEGIWQGLKVINGRPDFSLFKRRPHKRHGQPEGHIFGDNVIGYLEARENIYVPAYVFQVVNNVLDNIVGELEKKIEPVVFYDVEQNKDIKDLSKPFSHASLLVTLLNVMKKAPLPPFSRHRFHNAKEQASAAFDYRESLKDFKREVFDNVINFAYLFSHEELKESLALYMINQGLPHKGNLKTDVLTEKARELHDLIF
jgi:hypothetical protein